MGLNRRLQLHLMFSKSHNHAWERWCVWVNIVSEAVHECQSCMINVCAVSSGCALPKVWVFLPNLVWDRSLSGFLDLRGRDSCWHPLKLGLNKNAVSSRLFQKNLVSLGWCGHQEKLLFGSCNARCDAWGYNCKGGWVSCCWFFCPLEFKELAFSILSGWRQRKGHINAII